MKKFLLILFLNLFLFNNSIADIDKIINQSIEKEFEDYKKNNKIKIDKLKEQDLNEAKKLMV